MEENQPKSTKAVLPIILIALVVVAAVVVYNNRTDQANSPDPVLTTTGQTTPVDQSQLAQQTNDAAVSQMANDVQYSDGVYNSTGTYNTPGGEKQIEVSLTLENGVVTDTTFTGTAQDPASKRFQGEFGDNYKAQVIGIKLDELNLTKVSGSSLTPKGFNDAVAKIKQQAAS